MALPCLFSTAPAAAAVLCLTTTPWRSILQSTFPLTPALTSPPGPPGWTPSSPCLTSTWASWMRLGWNAFPSWGSPWGLGWPRRWRQCALGRLDRLVLVSAVGIKPQHGEIAEIFTVSRERVGELRFYDTAQVPDYDRLFGRDMTPAGGRDGKAEPRDGNSLVLEALHAQSQPAPLSQESFYPTLVVWGKQDAIAPVECAELYSGAIPNSKVHVIDRCGHSPQLENPKSFWTL